MPKVKVECTNGLDLVWRIKVGAEEPQVLDEHLAYKWLYKGMELWQAYDDPTGKITVGRAPVMVAPENFNRFKAFLIVHLCDFKLVSAKLVCDPLYVPIAENLTKFSFEAWYP